MNRSRTDWFARAPHGLATTALLLCLLAPRTQLAAQSAPPAPAPDSAPPAEQSEEATPVYNGDWWLSLGGWEQYGFISGYQDCYTSEYRGSAAFTREIQSYVDELNKYFLGDPARRKLTVSEALDELRGAASDSASPPSKATMPAPPDVPVAVYDGRFWFDADQAAQLGFVEGYLACHGAKVKDSDGHFSRAPSEYVDLLNKEYGITDDSDDIDADKSPLRIGDVLHRLKDADTPPPKPAA